MRLSGFSAVSRSCFVAKVMVASSTSGNALNLASILAAQLAHPRFCMMYIFFSICTLLSE